jgi:NAD(P)-dependent dehydrogenase (short-subunit alcohol dehydrogenase family)
VRALVTGASRGGIGGAIALRLARDAWARREDARIALSATGINDDLKVLVTELADLGAEFLVLPGDLTGRNFPGELVREATGFCGGLDLVVSNAGQSHHGQLTEASLSDWDHAMNLHARAAWLLAKAAYPFLAASRGSFIATGSVTGTLPHAGKGAYPVAKAALIMACQTLALEWASSGVRVNVVSPGLISTQGSPKPDAGQVVPLARGGLPEDVAGVVAFLAGPDAGFITGQNVLVDGGLLAAGLERVRRG